MVAGEGGRLKGWEGEEHAQVSGRREGHFGRSGTYCGWEAGDAVNMQDRKIVRCSPDRIYSLKHKTNRPLGCACQCFLIQSYSALHCTLPIVV